VTGWFGEGGGFNGGPSLWPSSAKALDAARGCVLSKSMLKVNDPRGCADKAGFVRPTGEALGTRSRGRSAAIS